LTPSLAPPMSINIETNHFTCVIHTNAAERVSQHNKLFYCILLQANMQTQLLTDFAIGAGKRTKHIMLLQQNTSIKATTVIPGYISANLRRPTCYFESRKLSSTSCQVSVTFWLQYVLLYFIANRVT